MVICPRCGDSDAIRCHSDYVTRKVDFYLCEACGEEWEPVPLAEVPAAELTADGLAD